MRQSEYKLGGRRNLITNSEFWNKFEETYKELNQVKDEVLKEKATLRTSLVKSMFSNLVYNEAVVSDRNTHEYLKSYFMKNTDWIPTSVLSDMDHIRERYKPSDLEKKVN